MGGRDRVCFGTGPPVVVRSRPLRQRESEQRLDLFKGEHSGVGVSTVQVTVKRLVGAGDATLLPRYDVVVHHAGTGVLNATLAAGVPAVVVPLDYDQFDYATRLRTAGLAIGVRSLRHLSRAIEQALAGATSSDARRRFRELVLDQSGGDNVRALVRRRLGNSTEGTDPARSARSLEG